jgi:hypothetical protein
MAWVPIVEVLAELFSIATGVTIVSVLARRFAAKPPSPRAIFEGLAIAATVIAVVSAVTSLARSGAERTPTTIAPQTLGTTIIYFQLIPSALRDDENVTAALQIGANPKRNGHCPYHVEDISAVLVAPSFEVSAPVVDTIRHRCTTIWNWLLAPRRAGSATILASITISPRHVASQAVVLSRKIDVRHVWGWLDVKDVAGSALGMVGGAVLGLLFAILWDAARRRKRGSEPGHSGRRG